MDDRARAGRLADNIAKLRRGGIAVHSSDVPLIITALRAYAGQEQRAEAATSAEGAKGDGGTGCQLTIPEAQSSAHQSTSAKYPAPAVDHEIDGIGRVSDDVLCRQRSAAEQTATGEISSGVDREDEKVTQSGSSHTSPVPTRGMEPDCPAAPLPEEVQRELAYFDGQIDSMWFYLRDKNVDRSIAAEWAKHTRHAFLRAIKRRAVPEGCVVVPIATLQHCIEYWNGNVNQRAMQDALDHIIWELGTLLPAAAKEGKA